MQMVIMPGILLEDIIDRKITKNVILNFKKFFSVFRGNQFSQTKLSPMVLKQGTSTKSLCPQMLENNLRQKQILCCLLATQGNKFNQMVWLETVLYECKNF